jgi:hypothetical protein
MNENIPYKSKLLNFKMSELITAIAGILAFSAGSIIGISDNPPGIILVLLGAFTVLYAILSHFGNSDSFKPLQKFIYWAPRTLCIITASFLSIFALDVFRENQGILKIFFALMMHLIPTFIMIIIIILSWRREWIGGILFNLLGIFYIVAIRGRFPIATYFLIAGPLILTGVLFLLSWKFRALHKVDKQIIAE